jgi:acetoin utilization deacetylase AcuC-like enzyme
VRLKCRTVDDVLRGILDDFRPDVCLYDAGVDPHADDELGRLCLSDRGLYERDRLVRCYIPPISI